MAEKNLSSAPHSPAVSYTPCSLSKRAGCILYDGILLTGVVFIAWLPVPVITEWLSPALPPVAIRGLRLAYLVAVCFFFFAWPWRHGGQTLGMRAWKVQLIPWHAAAAVIPWRICWLRFIAALLSWAAFGMGFLWALGHPDRLAWHDIYSATRLVVIREP